MSEKSPEVHVKDALHASIDRLLRAKEEVETAKRTLRDAERAADKAGDEVARLHRGLVALVDSTEADCGKYIQSYKQANRR